MHCAQCAHAYTHTHTGEQSACDGGKDSVGQLRAVSLFVLMCCAHGRNRPIVSSYQPATKAMQCMCSMYTERFTHNGHNICALAKCSNGTNEVTVCAVNSKSQPITRQHIYAHISQKIPCKPRHNQVNSHFSTSTKF